MHFYCEGRGENALTWRQTASSASYTKCIKQHPPPTLKTSVPIRAAPIRRFTFANCRARSAAVPPIMLQTERICQLLAYASCLFTSDGRSSRLCLRGRPSKIRSSPPWPNSPRRRRHGSRRHRRRRHHCHRCARGGCRRKSRKTRAARSLVRTLLTSGTCSKTCPKVL